MQFEGATMTHFGIEEPFQLLPLPIDTNDIVVIPPPHMGPYRKVIELFNRLGTTQAPSDLFAGNLTTIPQLGLNHQ
jgi:hypothetical protein